MKYMLLLNRNGDATPDFSAPQYQDTVRAYGEAIDAMRAAGVFVDTAPLAARSSGTVVRVRDGETILTDIPAAEIKEQLGGYTIVDCENLDEALKWAARIPAAWEASIEVRPIVEVPARV